MSAFWTSAGRQNVAPGHPGVAQAHRLLHLGRGPEATGAGRRRRSTGQGVGDRPGPFISIGCGHDVSNSATFRDADWTLQGETEILGSLCCLEIS